MFERFDAELKQVLVGAPADAALTGSSTIEAEHLLVGLASAPRCAAGRLLHGHGVTRGGLIDALRDPSGGFTDADAAALASVGVDLRSIQQSADEVFGDGAFARAGVRPSRGTPRFGESAKAALALALQESIVARSKRISTVHLLLAVLRDPDGGCAGLLEGSGVDYGTVRREADAAA